MQYFKPKDPYFVGDCMPFFHDGVLHLYYLWDENHHGSLGGLGGHQWAHASSRDLVHWTHHPMAIPITADWEASICTGSMFYHDGTFYAFYATRRPDGSQHVSLAKSRDGIIFEKTQPNPLILPPLGYSPYHFRDPHVFWDDGTKLFHMLVTSQLVNYPVPNRGGFLAHLVSRDLKDWSFEEPFLIPGYDHGEPECPEHFRWNDWYYLVFGIGGVARYRMSRNPLGPWTRPPVDAFEGRFMYVMKTAAFTGNRRIGAAFLCCREGHRDNGQLQWAGNAVFREIVQHPDGTLGVKFVPEMSGAASKAVPVTSSPLTANASIKDNKITLKSSGAFEVAAVDGVPGAVRITARVHPSADSRHFGLRLRGFGRYLGGYDLSFRPCERTVELHNESIACVDGLDRPFDLEIVLKDDIVDVCVDHRRCLVNRLPELKGDRMFVFAHNADVTFDDLTVSPLL